MSEFNPGELGPAEPSMNEGGKIVSIVAIIAFVIVSLACITACTVMAYAFLMNPPW